MRNTKLTVLALLAAAAPLVAQEGKIQDLEARHRAQVAAKYGAGEWTRGPARAGLANALTFEGFQTVDLTADAGQVVRRYRRDDLRRPAFVVTSHVTDRPAVAHAELLTWLAGLQNPAPMPAVERLGDVAYVGPSGAAEGAHAWVAFVRGNVFVRLKNHDANLEPGLDLIDLAREIDLGLLATPELAENAKPARPTIEGLSLGAARVVAGARVPLAADVTDAHGGAPLLTWSLRGDGLGYVEEGADGQLYLYTTGPGTIEVVLEATSSGGTFTRATVSLEALDD